MKMELPTFSIIVLVWQFEIQVNGQCFRMNFLVFNWFDGWLRSCLCVFWLGENGCCLENRQDYNAITHCIVRQ